MKYLIAIGAAVVVGLLLFLAGYCWTLYWKIDEMKGSISTLQTSQEEQKKPPAISGPAPEGWIVAPGADVNRAYQDTLTELLAECRTTYEQLKARARKALEVPFRDIPAAPAKADPKKPDP